MTTTVQQDMGSYSFSFVEFGEGYKTYKYAQAEHAVNSFGKWRRHTAALRSRKHAMVLTAYKPGTGKTKASYDIVGMMCLFDNRDDLVLVNRQYWSALKLVDGDFAKLKVTWEFVTALKTRFEQLGFAHQIVPSTYEFLQALYLAAEQEQAK